MTSYCRCNPRTGRQTFSSSGLVFCSNCMRVVCCDDAGRDFSKDRHAAEVADGNHCLCWRHFDEVSDLAVPHFA